jgi:predicted NUDIX family NTP pyrophosphohydrolase
MKISAGILLYRIHNNVTEFLLVHPGGPFFAKKHEGWWTVPKGEPEEGEALLDCALREFKEETGYAPAPPYLPLTPITQKGGKKVYCWAAKGDFDCNSITCNTFEIEWPPKSGLKKTFPEVDKAGWFGYNEAVKFINERQVAFIDETIIVLKQQ